jgi:hypothetical protein
MADFRSKRRIPLISWVHPANNAVLLRAAQPLRGIMGQRCAAEERFVHEAGYLILFFLLTESKMCGRFFSLIFVCCAVCVL